LSNFLRSAVLAASALLLGEAALAQTPLRVMMNADIRSTEPGVNTDLNTSTVLLHVLEGLVAYREDTSIGPMLAEKVDLSADGLTYSFTLRDGVTFHNGAKLDSAAVAATWKRYMDPATQWRCLTEFDGRGAAKVLEIATPDPKTVVFRIEKPSAMFLGQMARLDCGGSAIYHSDSLGSDGKMATPIGTGPYKMAEWRRGQYVDLEKFAGYQSRGGERDGLTGGKTAFAEKIRFIIIPDGAAAKAALFSGSLDVRPDFSASDIDEARTRRDVKIESGPTLELNGVLFQTTDPLLSDVRIRRAISLTIDREALVETLTNGLVKSVSSPIPLFSPYSSPVQQAPLPFNLAEAKKLLAEAGYKGQPIKMLVTKRYMSLYNGAVFVQSMAKAAGVNIELEVLEWATLLDLYLKGTYQSMFFSYSARLDAALSFQMLTGPKATQPNKVWDNPEAVELINKALTISDKAARQALFDDLHKRFVADLPMIPLWNSADIAAYRSNVTGYKTWPASMPRLWGVKVN